jgi:hypothetical protein
MSGNFQAQFRRAESAGKKFNFLRGAMDSQFPE